MTREMHLLGEDIQEITLQAFPIIFGKENKYDLDSRDVLETFREWAEEFERWWNSHNEDWKDNTDWLEKITDFTDKKVGAYLRKLNYKNN